MAKRSGLDRARTGLLRAIRACERSARGKGSHRCSPERIAQWAERVEREARRAELRTRSPERAGALQRERLDAANLRAALRDPDRARGSNASRIREVALAVQRAPLPQELGLAFSAHYIPPPRGMKATEDPFMPEEYYEERFGTPRNVRGFLLTDRDSGRDTWMELDEPMDAWSDLYSLMRAYYGLGGRWTLFPFGKVVA